MVAGDSTFTSIFVRYHCSLNLPAAMLVIQRERRIAILEGMDREIKKNKDFRAYCSILGHNVGILADCQNCEHDCLKVDKRAIQQVIKGR